MGYFWYHPSFFLSLISSSLLWAAIQKNVLRISCFACRHPPHASAASDSSPLSCFVVVDDLCCSLNVYSAKILQLVCKSRKAQSHSPFSQIPCVTFSTNVLSYPTSDAGSYMIFRAAWGSTVILEGEAQTLGTCNA